MEVPLAKMTDLDRVEGQPSTGLTVWLADDTHNAYTRMGLTTEAAFVYLLVLTHCSAETERIGAEMVLRLVRRVPEPSDQVEVIGGARREAALPVFRTAIRNDAEAREDLMLQVLNRGVDGVRCATDEDVLIADEGVDELAMKRGAKVTADLPYDFYQPKG